MVANERTAKKHIRNLKETLAEKKNNGLCAEYSNMMVSLFNSDHLNNEQNK
jgi:hypothetical protein